MDENGIRALLGAVKNGDLDLDEAVERLKQLPYQNLGFARVDHHRALRRGFPEVVFGGGKTVDQLTAIVRALADAGPSVLVTRVAADVARAVMKDLDDPHIVYHEQARCLVREPSPNREIRGRGRILVVAAGTSDIPVAEEAAVTAEVMGNEVGRIFDVGVAGLHRLLHQERNLRSAEVLIVVAGMEGALPSVVGGLVDRPVIAVPTSVGYGAAFEGLAALLGMLNSCASGVTVVNIDNGFGAGYAAALMNRRRSTPLRDEGPPEHREA